jgi:hypothetical protein
MLHRHETRPFGSAIGKLREDLVGEAVAVLPSPLPSNVAGYTTAVAFEIDTVDRTYRFSIDDRSASFLAHALLNYLKPFQSSAISGTSSAEASNQSV